MALSERGAESLGCEFLADVYKDHLSGLYNAFNGEWASARERNERYLVDVNGDLLWEVLGRLPTTACSCAM